VTRREPSEPALALSGVGVRIDGRPILHDIDWQVAHDERWVVIGPNGCGKTTLLRVAGMALHPSTGEVTVLGATLGSVDVRSHRRQIGVVSAAVANALRPGIAAIDVVMTARYGALEPWWHEYTEADRARAAALLERFAIGHLADHAFGTMSSGERQRTVLARSLMTEPGLVLLDEPASGLDLGAREALLADLAALAGDPHAPPMVIVTHHLEEIPHGVTHAMLLREGHLVASGPVDSTLTSTNLSACFDQPLVVGRDEGRWRVRGAAVSPPP
jgi:iron complex transport system ATP-binding protein